jgi:hypothetical protein
MSSKLFGHAKKNLSNRRTRLNGFELLEKRAVLTSTIWLDFGDQFEPDGFDLTFNQLKASNLVPDDGTIFGINGPNLVGRNGIIGGESIKMKALSTLVSEIGVDYNEDGIAGDNNDYLELRANVIALV